MAQLLNQKIDDPLTQQGEIVCFCHASVLLSNDVIYFMRSKNNCLRDKAIFTASTSALVDEAP